LLRAAGAAIIAAGANMRVLLLLSNPVPAFEPTEQQLRGLSARLVGHELVLASTEAAFLAALPLADAAVVWHFAREWWALAPRLRHVFTPSAGREPFGTEPSHHVVRHFGRFHGAIMGESLLAMLTFMNRRLGDALAAQRERRWDRAPFSACRRLHGQVALIIGFGAIGQRCAELLSALGMQVHGVRRDVTQPSPPAQRLFTPEQRLEALAGADHVVCVLPGDTGTDRFLDARGLASMKPGAIVYNLGRGNAIDADALCRALSEGRLGGAFLDVQPEEPPPPESPLWSTPNLYMTPHASAISAEYLDLYFDELVCELATLA
jgi:D-2-hydroxyacid dehydrogenase (NADP+)